MYPNIIVMVVLFFMTACGSSEEPNTTSKELKELPGFDLHSDWVDSIYNTLNLEEKIGQLIWAKLTPSDTAANMISKLPLGGVILNTEKEKFYNFRENTDSIKVPLLLGTSNWYWPLTLEDNPWNSNHFKAIGDTAFRHQLINNSTKYLTDLGIHFIHSDVDSTGIDTTSFPFSVHTQLNKNNIAHSYHFKTAEFKDLPEHPIVKFDFHNRINDVPSTTLLIKGMAIDTLENCIDSIISIVKNDKIVLTSNLFSKDIKKIQDAIHQAIEFSLVKEEDVEFSVRKVLAMKELLIKKGTGFSSHKFEKQNIISLRSDQYLLKVRSICLLRNQQQYLPLKDWSNEKLTWVKIGKEKLSNISNNLRHYTDIDVSVATINNLALNKYPGNPIIIILNEQLDSVNGNLLADKIDLYAHNKKIVLVNFKYAQNLQYLKNVPCLIQAWEDDPTSQEIVAQALFGGWGISGRLPFPSGSFEWQSGLTSKKTRLAYSIPELGGFNRDSLKTVDKIGRETIYTKVTPGCQILAVRKGNVIYNKTFGYHTYERNLIVEHSDVYDIASLSKVVATTLCGMKMYEDSLFHLSDSLKDHLPDSLTRALKHKSRLSNITFQELFTHTSGLPSGLPIYKFIAYVDSIIGKFDRYYCDESNSDYCVEVARNFYLDSAYLDSLWIDMHRIWPGEKKYKYSDANMNLLYQIFRSKIEESYHEFIANSFYRPLKLRATTFLPLNYLDTIKHRIAPTEFDTYWRYQLLKGSVHDPNAALYGGVAGNAGVFSNANELAVIFQMLMNNGSYGGRQYLNPQTVRRFTTHQVGSHRGLGFDKPTGSQTNTVSSDCPSTAYGHTGFTGICAWADPENDLIFIFVSNRVHPDPNNKKIITYGTRKRLHQVFYDQLIYSNQYKNKLKEKTPAI